MVERLFFNRVDLEREISPVDVGHKCAAHVLPHSAATGCIFRDDAGVGAEVTLYCPAILCFFPGKEASFVQRAML